MGTKTAKWDKNRNKVGTQWKPETEQSAGKVGTRTEKGDKYGKVGTRNPKWEKNFKVRQEWERSGNKVGTRTPKWEKIGTE